MSIGFRDSLGAYGATAGAMARRWTSAPDSIVAAAGAYGYPAYRLVPADSKHLRIDLTAVAEIIWHFFLKPTAGADTSELILLKDVANNICCLQLMADGALRFRSGDASGTILHTTAAAFIAFDVEAHWQVRIKAHNSAGELEVKIENVQVLNLSGLDTIGAGTSIKTHWLGKGIAGDLSHPICVLIDGVGPNTFLGKKLVYIEPANGDVAAMMTQVGGTGGQPFTAVDEVALNEADYNEGDDDEGASAWDEENEYQYANAPTDLAGIVEVSKTCVVDKVGGFDPAGFTQFIKSNATRSSSTAVFAPIGASYRTHGAALDPDGGIAWTAAKVNALTGGEAVVWMGD